MHSYSKKKITVPRFKEELGFYTTAARSKHMSRIRSRNTKPEMLLRKKLWSLGYRYRIDWKKLPGKPDIFLNKYKLIIFVDGEFWHGHNWEEKKKKIKSNRGFWIPKIERNMQRDEEINNKLQSLGYTVLRFWASEIKDDIEACIFTISQQIENNTE